jgi:Derlin-2/3
VEINLLDRTITAATLIVSIAAHAQLLPFEWIMFQSELIKTFPPRIWLFVTAFFLTGPKLDMVFSPFFLFSYGSSLEKSPTRFPGPGDFLTYVVFIASFIAVSSPVFPSVIIPNGREKQNLGISARPVLLN